MRAALAAVVLLAGCGESRTTLRARIDSSAPITSLQVRVGIGGGAPGAANNVPARVPGDLLVILPDVATVVTLDVVGQTAAGELLHGTGSGMSIPHEEVLVAITLGGALGDGAGMVDAGMHPDGAVSDFSMNQADEMVPDLVTTTVDQTIPKTFIQEPSTVQGDLYGVFGSGPTDVYACGVSGVILHSTGNGVWKGQVSNSGSTFTGGIAFGPNDLYIVGSGGAIFHSVGNGVWVGQTTPTSLQLAQVFAFAPDDIYVVGDMGLVLHSTGGGVWTTLPAPTTSYLFSAWGASPTDLWVAGDSGAIFHSADHGMTWQDYSINSGGLDVNAMWGSSATDIYGGMDGGNVIHWDGNAWTALVATQANGLEGAWGSSATDVYLSGDGILHSSNGGKTWESAFGQGLQYFYRDWGSGPGDVYTVGKAGVIFHLK